MNTSLLWLVLLIAVLDWVADANGWRALEYLVKPGTIAALLAWMWQASRFYGPLRWFALGLAFSLVGDVLLILPADMFIFGLIAFLLAHLAYVAGFNTQMPPLKATSLALALGVGTITALVFREINAGLTAQGSDDLRLPVLIYTIVIAVMLLSALLTWVRPEWDRRAALMVSVGAALFFLSDTLLAYNKFVSPLSWSLTVIITYHIGQAGLAMGAVMHFRREFD